jgi:ribosomal-protein-alanine N-acetyltransferase
MTNASLREIGRDGLIGSPPTDDDFEALVTLFSDEAVVATLGGVRSQTFVRELLMRWQSLWEERGFGPWIFREVPSRRFIGYVGVAMASAGEAGEVELLYGLMPDFWGAGVATRASTLAIDFVFEQREQRKQREQIARGEGLDELIAYTLIENQASRRVMEKLGFSWECEIAHAGFPHAFYRLKRSHWEEGRMATSGRTP